MHPLQAGLHATGCGSNPLQRIERETHWYPWSAQLVRCKGSLWLWSFLLGMTLPPRWKAAGWLMLRCAVVAPLSCCKPPTASLGPGAACLTMLRDWSTGCLWISPGRWGPRETFWIIMMSLKSNLQHKTQVSASEELWKFSFWPFVIHLKHNCVFSLRIICYHAAEWTVTLLGLS